MTENWWCILGWFVVVLHQYFPRGTTNNKYQNNFYPKEESKFCFFVDANDLYVGVMEKLPLPLMDFKNVQVSLYKILNTTIDINVGYTIEVGLEYADALHNLQEDFPLAATKENIEECFLSDYQLIVFERMGSKNFKQPKLLQTLNSKTNYTVHYLNLQFYVPNDVQYVGASDSFINSTCLRGSGFCEDSIDLASI